MKQFYVTTLFIFLMGALYAQQPVAHWTFDQQNADDVSGNEFNGTVNNVTFDKGVNCDTAAWFSGVNSYIAFGDILDSLFTKGTFSISMWAFPRARDDNNNYPGFLIQKWHTSSSTDNAFILRLFRFDGENNSVDFQPLSLNVWSHIAVSADSGNVSVYVNGEKVVEDSGFVFRETSYGLRLGNLHNNHYEFKGGIDDVRIYNEAISEQTIHDIMELNNFHGQYTRDAIQEKGNEVVIGPEPRDGFTYSWNTGSIESQISVSRNTVDTVTYQLEIEDTASCIITEAVNVIWYDLEACKLARWSFNDSSKLDSIITLNQVTVDTGVMCSKSFYFDGDNAYISLGDTLDEYFSSRNDFSISLWVNLQDTIDPDSYPAFILSKWLTSGSPNNSFILKYNTLKFGDEKVIVFDVPELNTWAHYMMIRRDNVTRMYVNNELMGHCIYCDMKTSTQPLVVGAHNNNFYNLTGNVDEIKIYDLAISEKSREKLYREGFVQPLGNLTDQTVEPASSITLDAGSGFDTYQWSDGDTTQMNTFSNISSDIIDLSVLVINENGCFADTVSVFVNTEHVADNNMKSEIKIWPCPVQDKLNVTFEDIPAHQIEIYTITGQLGVAVSDVTKNNIINMSNLPQGTYIIKFYYEDGVVAKEIIKY